jgi:hypothetical protein
MGFVFACGYCKTPLKGPASPNPNTMLKCPSCGQAETFENVKRIVAEFVKETAHIKIEEMLRAVARHRENLRTATHPTQRACIALSPST